MACGYQRQHDEENPVYNVCPVRRHDVVPTNLVCLYAQQSAGQIVGNATCCEHLQKFHRHIVGE